MTLLEVKVETERPFGPWRSAALLAICVTIAVPWWVGVLHICGVL